MRGDEEKEEEGNVVVLPCRDRLTDRSLLICLILRLHEAVRRMQWPNTADENFMRTVMHPLLRHLVAILKRYDRAMYYCTQVHP